MRRIIVSKFVLSLLFVLAGINHFWHSDIYVAIMPPYLPWHREMVFLSGIAEVGLGILLLVPRWSRWAAWGLIALLIAVFPANIHMALHSEQFAGISPILLWLRLPMQLVLIGWIYWHTRPQVQAIMQQP